MAGVHRIQVLARIGLRLFAVGLVLSALGKAMQPHVAAAGLSWTRLDQPQRVVLVLIASLLESLVGGLLLVGGRCRAVLRAGASLAAALLVLHAIGMASHSSGCGCFGEIAVPDGAAIALLVLGVLGCEVAVRSADACLGRRQLALVLPLAIAVPTLAASQSWQSPASAEQELRRILALGSGERGTAIVGTWSCDECRRALEDALRSAAPDEQLFFVTRASQPPPDTMPAGSFVSTSIADQLWWRLAVSTPPRLLRFEPAAGGRAP